MKPITSKETIDKIIEAERKHPTFSAHNINSYKTNLPIESDNKELIDILKYFDSPKIFLPLFQSEEFRNGLSIEVRAEILDDFDLSRGITYRESLFHNHDFFEMMYVYSGHCTNYVNQIEMKLKEGDLLLYNLQTVHKLIIDDPEAVIFNILVGKEILNHSFMNLLQEDDPVMNFYINSLYNIPEDEYLIFNLNDSDALMPLHDLIIEFVNKDYLYAKVMRADYMNLLIRLARLRAKRQSNHSRVRDGSLDVNDVLCYIHENFREISLQMLADHYSYTTRTMIRFLKKYTHMSFSEIIRDYKMLNACNLLRSTSMSIDDIAFETGFKERGYFDKVFKQHFHITPAEYRSHYSE